MIHANYGLGAAVNKNTSSGALVIDAVLAASERILVIEDDRAVQKALKRLFEAEGFAVDIAGNGAAGLEMFRAVMPSVLVLDLSLPGTAGAGCVPRDQSGCAFVADYYSQCAHRSDGQSVAAGVGCA